MSKIKLTALMLAALLSLGALSGCGGAPASSAPAPAASSAPTFSEPASSSEAAASAAPVDDGSPKTSKENPVYVSGEMPKITGPVLVASAGQGGDTQAMDTVLTKAGIEHTIKAAATASDIAAAKTVFVVVGASMKGLGAAGVSLEQELARAKAMLAGASDDTVIICAHIGGDARRGDTSDPFIDLVMPESDALFAVEGGNTDGRLTQLANENGVPYTLIYAIASGINAVKDMAA